MDAIGQKIEKFVPTFKQKQNKILSSDHPLYLIESDNGTANRVRGMIVDVEKARVVVPANKVPLKTNADELTLEKDDSLILHDENGKDYKMDPKTFTIKPGFEGAYVRMFRHNGKTHVTNFRNIDYTTAKWGKSDYFNTMFDHLIKCDELYAKEKAYGKHIYCFVIVSPQLMVATHAEIGEGFVIYLGHEEMPDVEGADVDMELREPKTVPMDVTNLKPNQVYGLPSWSVDQANIHLRFGFERSHTIEPHDPRLGNGEFVIVETPTAIYRVASTAYRFREMLRNADPNIYRRAFSMFELAHSKAYGKSVPTLPASTYNDFAKKVKHESNAKLIEWLKEKPTGPVPYGLRLQNLYEVFVLTLPPAYQDEMADFYPTMLAEYDQIFAWLKQVLEEEWHGFHFDHPVYEMITEIRNYCKSAVDIKKYYDTINGDLLFMLRKSKKAWETRKANYEANSNSKPKLCKWHYKTGF